MKKGTQIVEVVINKDDDKVTAYASIKGGDKFVFPLTRTQRGIMKHYKQSTFRDEVIKEFNNPNIIPDELVVIRKQGGTEMKYIV